MRYSSLKNPKWMMLFVLLLTASMLCACGAQQDASSGSGQSSDTESTDIGMDIIDSGQLTAVDPKAAVISLNSNPTTGYNWYPDEDNSAADGLQVDLLGYIPDEVPADTVGSGGTTYYTAAAEKDAPAGDYKITFAYYRPWETIDTAVNTAVVTVTIDDSGNASCTEPEIR